jgi:hypothetical protein
MRIAVNDELGRNMATIVEYFKHYPSKCLEELWETKNTFSTVGLRVENITEDYGARSAILTTATFDMCK